MADKIFAQGFRFNRPHEKAPDFIKGSISIKADEAIEFIKKHQNEKGWLNIDLKKSQSGTLYLELNTFQKGQKEEKVAEINSEDIPL